MRHKAPALSFVVVLLLAASLLYLRPASLPSETLSGRVVHVADGDTITLLRAGQQVKVRLFGIDCPEKAQAFGAKAKEFTAAACFGQTVTVQSHQTDRYGRTLGTVMLPDGRNLNQELVKAGLAWHYTAYSHDPTLAGLEAQARSKRLGLWADPHPQPPWEYRKDQREASQQ